MSVDPKFINPYNTAESKLEPLLTVDDVSRLLNISKAALYQMTSRREIPYFKVGNRLRFRQSVIEQWLRAQEVESGS